MSLEIPAKTNPIKQIFSAMDENDPGLIDRVATDVSRRWNLPDSTLIDLRDEAGDWQFVIQVYVLLEAALSRCIIAELSDVRLVPWVEKMNMGGKAGKLDLAKSIGVITSKHQGLIEWMSALRNGVAHKLAFLNFSFDQFVTETSTDERNTLKNKLQFDIEGWMNSGLKELTGATLRSYIWLEMLKLLQHSKVKELNAKLEEQMRVEADNIYSYMMESRAP